jgi:hypothetical protein
MTDWATHAVSALGRGEQVTIRPRGNSMRGRVNDGDTVVLVPAKPDALVVGDVVLVRVKGRTYLHLVTAIARGRFTIGNNVGGTNGTVGPQAIFGRAISISR